MKKAFKLQRGAVKQLLQQVFKLKMVVYKQTERNALKQERCEEKRLPFRQ